VKVSLTDKKKITYEKANNKTNRNQYFFGPWSLLTCCWFFPEQMGVGKTAALLLLEKLRSTRKFYSFKDFGREC